MRERRQPLDAEHADGAGPERHAEQAQLAQAAPTGVRRGGAQMADNVSFDAAEPVWRFIGALTDDSDATTSDERAARHDLRGPLEMVEIVVGECAAWRAAALTENPTVAQTRVMSRHGEAIGAMVGMWAATGRRPYQYRYDGTDDVVLWNIPEAETGWFVFDPDASDPAGRAPWRRSTVPGGRGPDHDVATLREGTESIAGNSSPREAAAMGSWSFLTHHGRVLVCVAHDPGIRLREIAAEVAITERSVFAIVSDLAEAGYVVKRRDGRRNRYEVQAHRPLPDAVASPTIGEILDLLVDTDRRDRRSEATSPATRRTAPTSSRAAENTSRAPHRATDSL